MQRSHYVAGLIYALIIVLILLHGANAHHNEPPPQKVSASTAAENGCVAFPIAVHEATRSVTPPGEGLNPYPDMGEFEYPPAPRTYESFTDHQADVPLFNAPPGTVFRFYRGMNAGSYDWLVWNEGIARTTITLADSLTWPGNSNDYSGHGDPGTPLGEFDHVVRGFIEPGDVTNTDMDVGDRVAAASGIVSGSAVRAAVSEHVDLGHELRLPISGDWEGADSNSYYRIKGFAHFRVIGYYLPADGGWILLEFLAWDDACEEQSSWQQYLPLIYQSEAVISSLP